MHRPQTRIFDRASVSPVRSRFSEGQHDKLDPIHAKCEAFEEEVAHCYFLLHGRFITHSELLKFFPETRFDCRGAARIVVWQRLPQPRKEGAMKCTSLLMQDHKVILRGLDVLDQLANRVENGHAVEAEDVETILRFLQTFADDHHQGKEESALFPELLRSSAANQGPLRQMIFEHDQERSIVEGLEEAVRAKKGGDFVHFARRLTSLIRTHIHKEDYILFEIADRLLSADQDASICAQFDCFRIDLDYSADLRRLEWKYMRRTVQA
jgi:hemerythrin-like domain-containing protein